MADSYNPENLTGSDPTDKAWAVAWARFLLRDTTSPFQLADEELEAVLAATAFRHDNLTYYRPHVAAAALLEGDPDRPVSEGLLSASVTHRDATSAAKSIRSANRWIDDLIEAATGGVRPRSRTTLEPTF